MGQRKTVPSLPICLGLSALAICHLAAGGGSLFGCCGRSRFRAAFGVTLAFGLGGYFRRGCFGFGSFGLAAVRLRAVGFGCATGRVAFRCGLVTLRAIIRNVEAAALENESRPRGDQP